MDFPFFFFGARFWQPQNSKMAPNSDGSNCLIRMVITAVPSSWKAPRPHPIPLRAPMRQSDARCESVLAANNGRHLKPSNANATVCGAVSLAVSRITMPQSMCTPFHPIPLQLTTPWYHVWPIWWGRVYERTAVEFASFSPCHNSHRATASARLLDHCSAVRYSHTHAHTHRVEVKVKTH